MTDRRLAGTIRFDRTFATKLEAMSFAKEYTPPGVKVILVVLHDHYALATDRDVSNMRVMLTGETHRTEIGAQLDAEV